jgi:hypothetical protein
MPTGHRSVPGVQNPAVPGEHDGDGTDADVNQDIAAPSASHRSRTAKVTTSRMACAAAVITAAGTDQWLSATEAGAVSPPKRRRIIGEVGDFAQPELPHHVGTPGEATRERQASGESMMARARSMRAWARPLIRVRSA